MFIKNKATQPIEMLVGLLNFGYCGVMDKNDARKVVNS
jgi:hypothetical protein